MGHIKVTDLQGQEHDIEAETGLSVMEIIYDANVPIKASCFGCCSCSTCHVYVDAEWATRLEERSEEEEEVLDMVTEYRDNSRLCCQIIYNENLDGLRVSLTADTKPD